MLIMPASSLADHAPAEAATRAGDEALRHGAAWRREDGAAEILFEPVGDIVPKLGDLAGRLANWDRTSITVRPSIIEAAKSVRWWSVTGATVPCCDSATAAS